MPRKSLPYVNTYVDRTGILRSYLRMPGKPRIPLTGVPGSKEFLQSYKILTAKPPKKPPRARLRPPTSGKIYYLSDGEHIKIGFTTNWDMRLRSYGTYSPRRLELLAMHDGTKADEKRLHRKFRERRIKNEWFQQTPEILDHIRTMCELNVPNEITS